MKYGKKFFEYDQIDYYQIDFHEDQITELDNNQKNSKAGKLKYELIVDETPKDINDLEFLNYMSKIGYLKKKIDKLKFKEIDKIFVEKTASNSYTAACIPVFRDILVFKKHGKVIGVVKICFACHQYRVVGTNANTDNFGSDKDYDQLGKILLSI
ncbi:hypothetical protein [Chryseobacterium wanjuense]